MASAEASVRRPGPQVDPAALHDFWRVYEAAYDAMQRETQAEIEAHPEFGPIVRAMPKDALDAQRRDSRARLQRAIRDGAWDEYDANLQKQGAAYAKMGVTFAGWYDVLKMAGKVLVPRMVSEHGADPARLAGALLAMQGFFDHAMVRIGNAYLEAKELALRDAESRMRTTLDSIGDAVIATDTDGKVVRMNPVAEQLTGWPLGEAKGQPLTDVFVIRNEQTGAVAQNPVERVLREGLVVSLANHTELQARDGTWRPIADSGAPIRDGQGPIDGVVLVFRDQTEERRAEADRTRAAVLEAENRRVIEASRMKSEFLANMSHELRTPLNAILGFTELIHDGEVGPDHPEYKDFLRDILASGRHLLQLINDVLDLAKVEAGRLEFRLEPTDVAVVVGEVLAILRNAAQAKRIHVEFQPHPDVATVTLDSARLKQVLYNYVSNAIKFTPDGGRVTVRVRPDEGDTFRVEVEDTGVGIAQDDLPRLFVEFQQLDGGASKKHGGTGLGLALTRRLVEAQDGVVGVRSAVGRGSVFHAVLPRHGPAEAVAPVPRCYPARVPGAPAVLVVEDDERDQAAIVRVLTAAGYEVETAPTGQSALQRCTERRFDAITLDLLLPDTNGVDVLRALRESGRHKDVPVIVITMVSERGAVAGFAVHDLLRKPLDPARLLASLDRASVKPDGTREVLVVDDDPGSARLMVASLQQLGYAPRAAGGGEEGLQVVRGQGPPAAVVLDLVMPGVDGFQFLERFRQLPGCARVPVIVWTVKDLSTAERERLRDSVQGVLAKGGGPGLLDELRTFLPARTESG